MKLSQSPASRYIPLLLLLAAQVPAQAATNPCMIPFEEMEKKPGSGVRFVPEEALNKSGLPRDKFNLRGRYLVADLNTKDAAGNCKGVIEHYPFIEAQKPDTNIFPNLEDAELRRLFLELQGRHYEKPAERPPVDTVHGMRFCVGQTLSLCEIKPDKRIVEVARLATSAQSADGQPSLYEPYNVISLRGWENGRQYTALDREHDLELGGVTAQMKSGPLPIPYVSGGGWVMPNFIKWEAETGYVTRGYMGMHQLTRGESNIVVPGSPVSHGCFRLSRYGSILNRWWTPLGAKLFIRYTPGLYRKIP